MDRPCRTCRFGQGTIKCSGCANTWYCSEQCQQEHWFHKFECDAKPDLTTADYLGLACLESAFPTDEQTLIDYGFCRAATEENQNYLLGVYQGLFKYGGITPETVHGWRTKGVLISEIKKHIEDIPPDERGKYFPWFLKNQWVLDGKAPQQHDSETEKALKKLQGPLIQLRAVQERMQIQKANERPSGSQPSDTELPEFVFPAGWTYSGGSLFTSLSEINKIIATWPAEKVKCYHFCSLLLSGKHPTRKSELWITFGFCTCENTQDEMDLARRYRQLLKSYSFEVFYAAFASSRLYDLFLAQNLGPQLRGSHPDLKGVLALSPIRNWSVWDLKQFILRDSDEEDTASPPCPASPAMLDYGFFNCKTDGDINDLKAIYTRLFMETNMRPTDLHQACIDGKLNSFVTKWVDIACEDREKYKRLLKNIHPI